MERFWFVFPLLSAFFLATYNALLKRLFATYDEYVTTFVSLTFTNLLLLPFSFFTHFTWPPPSFFLFMGISLPLELLAMLLYIKALKVSPLTLTLPFLSLTPLYLLVTSFLLLGERVGGRGLAGILLLTVGGYVLNLGSIGSGLLEPFRSILREKGSLYMVFVSVLYSMTSALGKKAILLSSPLTFAFFYYPFLWISLGVFLCVRERGSLEKLTQRRGLIKALLPGLCNFLSIVFHVYGITLCLVPYFIALKRTSIIFGMIYGFFFFGEGQRLERLAGTLLMFSGLLMLIFP